MILKKIAMFVPLVLVAACVSGPGSDKSLAGRCSSGNLTFHIGESYMWVTPRNYCVDPGETYTATIQEHRGFTAVENKVRITSTTGWLNNKGNSPNRFEIRFTVPNGELEGDRKYILVGDGVGELDPAVRVRN